MVNDKVVKLELGCGDNPAEGFDIYLDRIDFGFNKVCEFESDKFPIEDDSIDYIRMHHVIEHIKDVKNVLNECHRVLREGGQLEIWTPYGLWPGAHNPDHYQTITASWVYWLRKPDLYRWYGYKPWIPVLIEEKENKEGEKYEVHTILKPNKYN